MKELSIEEKVKAYDEALKYAMIYYKDGNEDMKMMMKTCFPVLTEESEDERIRKEIIAFLTYYHTGQGNSVKYDDNWIAWLEKQGEAWSEEDEYYYGIVQYILNNERVGKADKENASNWFKSIKDRVQPQPKQEWSEEDEQRVENLLAIIEGHGYPGEVAWLKSLKERYCPQKHWKPTEEMLEALYRIIPQDVMEKSEDEILLDKLYQGLKYGRILSK